MMRSEERNLSEIPRFATLGTRSEGGRPLFFRIPTPICLSRASKAAGRFTIAALGRDGPPSKVRDGRFVFLCLHCSEMLAYVNPRTNFAHCFACYRNLNTIDLLRVLGYDFVSAVALLDRWLNAEPEV